MTKSKNRKISPVEEKLKKGISQHSKASYNTPTSLSERNSDNLCEYCSSKLPEKKVRRGAKYCDEKCRDLARKRRDDKRPSDIRKISYHDIAIISRDAVYFDLKRRGIEHIFQARERWPLIDFVIIHNFEYKSIKVITVRKWGNTIVYNKQKNHVARIEAFVEFKGCSIVDVKYSEPI